MKTIQNFRSVLFLFLCAGVVISCSKSKASSSTSLNGSWLTSVWGGGGDTAIISVSTATGEGTMTYLSAGAISATSFSVGEVIFTNITATGNGTYTALGEYRYKAGNQGIGHSNATLTLQSANELMVVYDTDPNTGITPPTYYWQRHTN